MKRREGGWEKKEGERKESRKEWEQYCVRSTLADLHSSVSVFSSLPLSHALSPTAANGTAPHGESVICNTEPPVDTKFPLILTRVIKFTVPYEGSLKITPRVIRSVSIHVARGKVLHCGFSVEIFSLQIATPDQLMLFHIPQHHSDVALVTEVCAAAAGSDVVIILSGFYVQFAVFALHCSLRALALLT